MQDGTVERMDADLDRARRERATNLRELHRAAGLFEGRILGQLEALAGAVIGTLRRRGFTVDPATEERIRAVDEINLLEWWLVRAARVRRLEDVFTDRWLSVEIAGPTTDELIRHLGTLPRAMRIDLIGQLIAATMLDESMSDSGVAELLARTIRAAREASTASGDR